MSDRPTLPWYDWVVFAAMLLVSVAIGVYHSLTGGKQRSTAEYFLGDRRMPLIPIMVSATVSYMSTITLLGYPAEMFAFGAQYWLGCISLTLGVIVAAVLFVPVFYPLKITSINEYLEMRFQSKLVKRMASIGMISYMLLVVGNWFYAPATAIEAVTGFPTWTSILIGSAVSILYTALGGFRAVVWVDFFQSFVMLGGLIAIIVLGTVKVGGLHAIWETNRDWDRLNFFVLDPDPTLRMNLWGLTFGTTLSWAGTFGFEQMGVQRYNALPTLTQARICVLSIIPGAVLISSLACLAGLMAFAYYASVGCDPVRGGSINNYNQILPYFVIDALDIPGFSGLMLACIFACSLSSISSVINGMTANIWMDFLQERMPNIRESRAANINKVIALVLGVLATGFAFLMNTLGGTILQMMVSVLSCIGGPLLALFIIAVAVPWVDYKSICCAMIAGFIFGVWLTVGYLTTDHNWAALPSPDLNCTDLLPAVLNNTTPASTYLHTTDMQSNSLPQNKGGLQRFYSLSFLLHREINCTLTFTLALLFSLFIGCRHPQPVPAKYLHPWVHYLWPRWIETEGHIPLEYSRCSQSPEPEDTDSDVTAV